MKSLKEPELAIQGLCNSSLSMEHYVMILGAADCSFEFYRPPALFTQLCLEIMVNSIFSVWLNWLGCSTGFSALSKTELILVVIEFVKRLRADKAHEQIRAYLAPFLQA